MGNSIVPYQGNQIIRTMDDAERAAAAMAKSGYFTDSRDAAQAVVKILAGQELGFGPFSAMTGVYIIQGRPSIGANLMAAAVKKSGRYNYRVTEMTEKVCSITFYEGGQEIGVSTFTIEDARKAGTKNLDKFPRNMLFARAMSNGARWFCPDVFNGSPVYTPEELGAEVNEEGDVINVSYTTTPVVQQAAQETGAVVTEQPAPQNGNGKTNGKTSITSELLERWSTLYEQALDLGLSVDQIDPNTITRDALIESGKALKARIIEAEKRIAATE
jgi:hypothetical protein